MLSYQKRREFQFAISRGELKSNINKPLETVDKKEAAIHETKTEPVKPEIVKPATIKKRRKKEDYIVFLP